MEILIISVFVLGYILITLEHSIKIDKLIPALGMMGVLWAIIALNHLDVYDINLELLKLEPTHIEEVLLHHLGKTAEILIFLLGAMTIVEIIDYFDGFSGIKQVIKTRSKVKILWIFGALAFVLSAIIDNLTATIVLITLLQKLVKVRSLKLWYAGLIIIAANAGGAWSPIGDITTTMLWIGNKVSEVNLVKYLIIPSLVCMVVPFLIASKFSIFKGELEVTEINEESISKLISPPNKMIINVKKGNKENPKYNEWAKDNLEEWNNSIDYILSIEPIQFSGGTEKQKIQKKAKVNPEWNAWNKKYKGILKIGKQ